MKLLYCLLISLIVCFLNLSLSHQAFAAPGPLGFGEADLQEPMSTDRPDFTESTRTIQQGHLQVELGYRYLEDDDTDLRVQDIPETLLRVGITDTVEARVSFSAYQDIESGRDNFSGTGDLTFGTKIRILEGCECNFELSTMFNLTVPSGSDEISQNDVSPGATILWAYSWEDPWSISGNLNLDAAVEEGDYYFEPSNSLSLSYAFTERIGAYAEYFGFYPAGGNAPSTVATHYVNGGFTFLIEDNLQLDILAGVGLNDTADDRFFGCGLSFRI